MPRGEPTRADLQQQIRELQLQKAALAEELEATKHDLVPQEDPVAWPPPEDVKGTVEQAVRERQAAPPEPEPEAETVVETPDPWERARRRKKTWTMPYTKVGAEQRARPVNLNGKIYTPGQQYTTTEEVWGTVMAIWSQNRDNEELLMSDRGKMVHLGSL
jgi:hypothetical protein